MWGSSPSPVCSHLWLPGPHTLFLHFYFKERKEDQDRNIHNENHGSAASSTPHTLGIEPSPRACALIGTLIVTS